MDKNYGINGKPFFYELESYPEYSFPIPRFRLKDSYSIDEFTWGNYLSDTAQLLNDYDGITRKQIVALFPKDAFELILEKLKGGIHDNERYTTYIMGKRDLANYMKYGIHTLALSLVYYYQRNVVRYFDSILYCQGNMELAHIKYSDNMTTPLGLAYFRYFNSVGLLIHQVVMNTSIMDNENDDVLFPISGKYSDFKKVCGDVFSRDYFDKKDHLHGKPIYDVLKDAIKTIQELDELYGGRNKIFGPDCHLDDSMSKTETEQVLYTYFKHDSFHRHGEKAIHGISYLKLKEHLVWNLRVKPLDFEGIHW